MSKQQQKQKQVQRPQATAVEPMKVEGSFANVQQTKNITFHTQQAGKEINIVSEAARRESIKAMKAHFGETLTPEMLNRADKVANTQKEILLQAAAEEMRKRADTGNPNKPALSAEMQAMLGLNF
jgi:hypothetical protein